MRFHTAIACAAILLGCAASSSAQTVSLQFNNGRVTLTAQNASLRTILTEWARVGGTRMVNHERISGAPVTLELTDVPERQALEVLLRSAAGYIATARTGEGGASTLSGVVILATTSAPRNQGPVPFNTTVLLPRPVVDEPQDQQNEANNRTVSVTPFPPTPGTGTAPVVVRVGAGAATFGTTTDTSAQATQPPSQQRPATTTTPNVLQGTSRPGEITPPAQPQPQQNQR